MPGPVSVGPSIDRSASNGLAFLLGSCQAYISLLSFCLPSPPQPAARCRHYDSQEAVDDLRVETQHLTRLDERKLAALEELKQSLLHQACNGEL